MFNMIKGLFTPATNTCPVEDEQYEDPLKLGLMDEIIVKPPVPTPAKQFTLSDASMKKLAGVKIPLVNCVKRAIQLTKIDFRVNEGVRSITRQKQLMAQGATQTMKSKHITGDAVDLVALIGGKVSWDPNLYDDIADAMKQAAKEFNVSVRWGAAWNVPNIAKWNGTMQAATNFYVDTRRKSGHRPFLDFVHFELS